MYSSTSLSGTAAFDRRIFILIWPIVLCYRHPVTPRFARLASICVFNGTSLSLARLVCLVMRAWRRGLATRARISSFGAVFVRQHVCVATKHKYNIAACYRHKRFPARSGFQAALGCCLRCVPVASGQLVVVGSCVGTKIHTKVASTIIDTFTDVCAGFVTQTRFWRSLVRPRATVQRAAASIV